MKYKEIEGFNYLIYEDSTIVNKTTGKVRKPQLTNNGYHEIGLYNKGKDKYCPVHRLVAKAFIPNPDNKPFVNHIDGNKINNHVNNLEWVTHQENMEHAKKTNLIKRGCETPVSIFTSEQIHESCRLMSQGLRSKDVAKITGVNIAALTMLRAKKCWVHITDLYDIPRRSTLLSIETYKWIDDRIKEGLTQSEIIKLSNNPKVTKHIIQDIRTRKRDYL